MQTLSLEGEKANIRVNCLAPPLPANDRGHFTPEVLAQFNPERVTPGLLMLVGDEAPAAPYSALAPARFAAAHVTLTEGLYLGRAPMRPRCYTPNWIRFMIDMAKWYPLTACCSRNAN